MTQTPKLTSAQYHSDYKIKFTFADGVVSVIDLENELWGEVFAPLKDLAVFKNFILDSELKTIVWHTGADLAPEFLYNRAITSTTPPSPNPTSASLPLSRLPLLHRGKV